MQHSESLLTEILMLLQTLNASVHDFQVKLKQLRDDVDAMDEKFQDFIDTAMPGDLVTKHATHHEKISRPNWLKRTLRRLSED